jgi:hypothetical protein
MYRLWILILMILPHATIAQWPVLYGHETFDATGRGISLSYDQGIIIEGAERIIYDGFLIGYSRKLDQNGGELWKRYFPYSASSHSTIVGVSSSPDGSFLLTGQIYEPTTDSSDGFAIKLNACGEKEWCKIFDIPGYSYCDDHIRLADGSYIIHAGHEEESYDRIWLYKLDANGIMIWKKVMDHDTNYFHETGNDLLLTRDSCILVSGFCDYIQEPGSGLGWMSPLWVKFDLDGNQLWDLSWFTQSGTGDCHSTIQDYNGNYYSAGTKGYGAPCWACFYKFTENGVPKYLKIVSHAGTASGAYSIAMYDDTTLFIGAAYATGNLGYSMVIKSDTAGNVIKTMDVPLGGAPTLYAIHTPENKVLGLGERYNYDLDHWEACLFRYNQNLEYDSLYTQVLTYDSLCPHPVIPEATINLDCDIVSIENPKETSEQTLLKIYPVPATEQVTLALPDYYIVQDNAFGIKTTTTYYQLKGEKTIEILDINGKLIKSLSLGEGQASVNVDVQNWSSGMYLARLICKGKVWTTGKILIR